MELKSEIGNQKAHVAFFHKFPFEVLFYLDGPERIHPIHEPDELNEFLSARTETKVLISRGEFHDELVGILPAGMATQRTLKERVNPWEEESKKYEAWIIRSAGK